MTARLGAGRTLRIRAILNGGGGTVRRLGEEAVRGELAAAFSAADVDAELIFAKGEDITKRAKEALEAARRGNLDGVAIGGGDGSVGSVAAVMADSGVPMGVLPLGTLNHFSKDLGVPQDLTGAAAVIGARSLRRVDIGEVAGSVFVNNSVIGVYPYMVSDRERRRSHGLGKWPAMALAFFRMLKSFPRRRLVIDIGGRSLRYRTPCMFVGVNEYRFEKMELRRASGMESGELWLFVAKHGDPWSFTWMALKAAYGGLDVEGEFDVLRAKEFSVRTRTKRIPIASDGEVDRLPSPVDYRVRPGALTVFAPVAADPEQARDLESQASASRA